MPNLYAGVFMIHGFGFINKCLSQGSLSISLMETRNTGYLLIQLMCTNQYSFRSEYLKEVIHTWFALNWTGFGIEEIAAWLQSRWGSKMQWSPFPLWISFSVIINYFSRGQIGVGCNTELSFTVTHTIIIPLILGRYLERAWISCQ